MPSMNVLFLVMSNLSMRKRWIAKQRQYEPERKRRVALYGVTYTTSGGVRCLLVQAAESDGVVPGEVGADPRIAPAERRIRQHLVDHREQAGDDAKGDERQDQSEGATEQGGYAPS